MKKRDILAALVVVAIWGANFTIIKLGIGEMPSLLLVGLRYVFTALPAVFFIKRPDLEWKYIIAYGLTIGAGQFGCLFYAMEVGMPAGIASIVLQCQAFFTFLFAALILKEKLSFFQLLGLFIAAGGLVLIVLAGVGTLSQIPVGAFLITLLGAAFWGIANIIVRRASEHAKEKGGTLNMLSLVVWASLFPPIPLFAAALFVDTPQTLLLALKGINGFTIFVIFYQAVFANIFGFGIWSRLIAKYSASVVAPLSLLTPVTGLLTALLILKEKMSLMQYVAGILIVSGVFITNIRMKDFKKLKDPILK